VPQKLYALDKFYMLPTYSGRDNEIKFANYLDKKAGKDRVVVQERQSRQGLFRGTIHESDTNEEDLFYPDWIILFKDGTIGIFDTKKGRTATDKETVDKADALQNKFKEFGKKYVGGIVIEEAGVWYYNDSPTYLFKDGQSVNDNRDWKTVEKLSEPVIFCKSRLRSPMSPRIFIRAFLQCLADVVDRHLDFIQLLIMLFLHFASTRSKYQNYR